MAPEDPQLTTFDTNRAGLVSTTVPVYVAELSPPEIRGKLVTLNTCFYTGGQFVAGIIAGAFAEDKSSGWRLMLGLAAVPSFIQFFGLLTIPESPRWLVAQGRYQEALKVLKNLREKNTNVEEEFDGIKTNCLETEREVTAKGTTPVFLQIIRNPAVKRALTVGCLLQLTQQLVGTSIVMYYSVPVIKMNGISEKSTVIWISTGTAAVIFFCSFIGLFVVEKVGRRPLTLFSLAGVAVSLGTLAVGFQLVDIHSPQIDVSGTVGSDNACSSYSMCSKCVNDLNCGYCFFNLPSGPSNGSCLLAGPDKPDISTAGLCNGSVLEGPLTWAYEWCPSDHSWIILLGLVLHIMCFAPGMSSTPWTVNAEIYPLWARSTCYSIATSVNWLGNLFVSMTFLNFVELVTKYGTFWFYTSFAILGWIYFFLMLPETKGRLLEDVEGLFTYPWWQDATTADEEKTVQYVHIRGINQAINLDDQDSEDES
ncbi:proton myo-inositol cotransporter-like [Limulus polyphemus]|uniref:Proton myo-inositol cotransporter-like n=1 Tax=Limulus polyphemus TaxID=6850 RepID=A0ABM1S3E0_LIMPO|nr:proton myo-inositol cotransporter-like [Limulus polyphemus]